MVEKDDKGNKKKVTSKLSEMFGDVSKSQNVPENTRVDVTKPINRGKDNFNDIRDQEKLLKDMNTKWNIGSTNQQTNTGNNQTVIGSFNKTVDQSNLNIKINPFSISDISEINPLPSYNSKIFLGRKRLHTNLYNFDYTVQGVRGFYIEIINCLIREEDKNTFIRYLLENRVIKSKVDKVFNAYLYRGRFLYSYQPKEVRTLSQIPVSQLMFTLKFDVNSNRNTFSNISQLKIDITKKEEDYLLDDPNHFIIKFIPKIDLRDWKKPELLLSEQDLVNIQNAELSLVSQSNMNVNNVGLLSLNEQKIKVGNENSITFKEDRLGRDIKQFINIVVKAAFRKENLIPETSGRKQCFVLDNDNPLKVYNKKQNGKIGNDVPIYFNSAFKANMLVYQNNLCAIQIVDKFIMTRQLTFLDCFDQLYNNQYSLEDNIISFRNFCKKNQNGQTIHTNKLVRIFDVEFIDLTDIKYAFKMANREGLVSIYDYFVEKYSTFLKQNKITLLREQPILIEQVIKKEKYSEGDKKLFKEIISLSYFPSQVVEVRGKMEGDDFDISKPTILYPKQKFMKTIDFVRKIERANRVMSETNAIHKMNLNEVKIDSKILRIPKFRFGDKKDYIPENGEFMFQDVTPYENEVKNDFYVIKPILVFYNFEDSTFDNNKINGFINHLIEAGKNLKINVSPDEKAIYYLNGRFAQQDLENIIENLINKKGEDKEKKIYKKYNLIMLVMKDNKSKRFYVDFKNVFHNRQKRLKGLINQCLILEKVDKFAEKRVTNLSCYSSLLFQIWVKKQHLLCKLNYKDYLGEELFNLISNEKILLGAYCNMEFTSNTKKQITTFVGDLDILSLTESKCYYNKVADFTNKMCPHNDLAEIIKRLLESFSKEHTNTEVTINKSTNIPTSIVPNYLILFREYSQNIENIIQNEINPALKNLDQMIELQVYIVFVNKRCDLRLYSDMSEKLNAPEDLNETKLEVTRIHEVQWERLNIDNASIGTLIDKDIVRNTERIKEFYLVHTYKDNAAVLPTQYTVYSYRNKEDIIKVKTNDKNKWYVKEIADSETLYLKRAREEDKRTIDLIKYLSFAQSFSGQNSFKSLKIPALLHLALRMNTFITKNLDEQNIPAECNWNFGL